MLKATHCLTAGALLIAATLLSGSIVVAMEEETLPGSTTRATADSLPTPKPSGSASVGFPTVGSTAPTAVVSSRLTAASLARSEQPSSAGPPSSATVASSGGASVAVGSTSPSSTAASFAHSLPPGSAAPAGPPPLTGNLAAPAATGGRAAQVLSAALLPLHNQTAAGSAAGPDQLFRSDPSLAAPPEVEATPQGLHFLPNDAIWLMTASSQVFDFPYRLKRVSIANTKIADVQVINPYQINLIGHHPGFTTLIVWDKQGHYEQRQVRVDLGGKQQVLLSCVIAQLDRAKIENQGLNLSAALKNTGLSLVGLPGLVASPYSPTTQLQVVSPGGGVQTLNIGATLPPGGGLIPMLLSQNLTYGVASNIGQWTTQNYIQMLENHQMAKVLAEPNLLANSGEKAQFLSGGEIPIVIAQALNTSVVFKQYGTKVTFLPTVVGRDDIEMLVEPEVSEPDYAHEVQLNGFMVPAFITRRAHTMVRLKNQQTLIIAGLNLDERHAVVQKVPYLGDIPYAGSLFRNTSYQDNSTDLVMIVTPQLVGPLPEGGEAYLPTSHVPMSSEEIRTRRTAAPDASRPRF